MKDKIILITGGTGSFGQAMTERLLQEEVKEIRIFSRNEKNQWEMKKKFNDSRLNFIIGDIKEFDSVNKAIENVDYVFHSAALKHVLICQENPFEAINTNVLGSENVILASIKNKVDKLVCLSTDKSANASTTYGSTKYLMECMCKDIDSKDTKIILTRYGNVLGSSGSVIPLFKELKSQNKPLTITNRSNTRFFMQMSEAIDLVLYALNNGNNKDMFVYNNKSADVGMVADCISDNQITIGSECIEKTDEALLTISELNHSELVDNYFRINENIKSDIKYIDSLTSDNAPRFTKEELQTIIDSL